MNDKYTLVKIDNAFWCPEYAPGKRDFEKLPTVYACDDCGSLIWNRSLHNSACQG